MIEQSSPPKRIEQILDSIYQLLSFDQKDKTKIQRLLQIFDEAIAVKKQLEVSQIQNQQSDEQVLQQCLKDNLAQIQKFKQTQESLNEDIESFTIFKGKIYERISLFFSSIYHVKQLQSLIKTNQRKLKVNQRLKRIGEEIKAQYELEVKSASQSYQQSKDEEETFINIKKELEKDLKLKKLKRKNLQKELQRCSIRQQRQREEYLQLLQKQNKDRLDKVKFTKHSQSFNMSSGTTTQQQKSIDIKPIPINIEIKAKQLKQEYKIQKSIAVVLGLSTLFLVIYYLTVHK